uniref:Uncharacterized protein n=1 Tax=Candidatus Methanogaster sp. ANME-2c ERB4 TaxID=2759911 RepID=A0A7G9YMJ6_9EURY|nr:hypothetical protein DHJJDJHP_00037 [Methanosarcinales archaeon ANME-2c ERB4]QNO49255.1 hypothetical protein LDNCKMAD_00020 [Methanosarcinales archaeon ANME-2c ERB4]
MDGIEVGDVRRFHFHPAPGSLIYICGADVYIKDLHSPTRFWADLQIRALFLFF